MPDESREMAELEARLRRLGYVPEELDRDSPYAWPPMDDEPVYHPRGEA